MNFLKSIITSLITIFGLVFLGLQFLSAYKTDIKNRAIDGCYQSSSYQAQYKGDNDQQITVVEVQKYIFDQCLVQKGIKLDN